MRIPYHGVVCAHAHHTVRTAQTEDAAPTLHTWVRVRTSPLGMCAKRSEWIISAHKGGLFLRLSARSAWSNLTLFVVRRGFGAGRSRAVP